MIKLYILILIGALAGVTYGLSFQPMIPGSKSTIVWYQTSNRKSTNYWIDLLNQFLEPYYRPHDFNDPRTDCEPGEPPKRGKVCDVKVKTWHPCAISGGYNYRSSDGGPCIFLKLKDISGWTPEYYNSSTVPDLMPNFLKDRIISREQNFGANSGANNMVWVTCSAENPADVENIGPIAYFPISGFDAQYFPMLHVDAYLSPLVAIHFIKPARGVLINIECKAWARNIIHDGPDGRGVVHFQLMIDG